MRGIYDFSASQKESEYAPTVSSGIGSFPDNADPNVEVDCSFKINLCFSEQSTQTSEMKDSVNEVVDSITTPIYINRISDIEPTTTLTSKPQNFEINISILEARLLKPPESDFVVNVEIGDIKKRTSIKESKEKVSVYECFTFYFNTIPAILFSKTLTISFSRNKSLLRFDRSIGHFNIDISTIFAQKDHRFYHKWAPIVDRESVLKGYVKCDLLVMTPNMVLNAPIMTEIEEDNIEENLLIPRAILTTKRRRVKYTVNVYRAEGLPTLKTSSFKPGKAQRLCLNAFVSVSFDGFYCRTSVCKSTLNPVWNEQITFEAIYPPLCQYIKIELCNESPGEQVLTTHYLNLHELSSEELQLLPTFGPSYIYLYGSLKGKEFSELGEGLLYFGRLLLSVDAEYCDEYENGETKSLSEVKVTDASPIDSSSVAKDDEFLFFAVINESNLISRKFTNKRISYELSIGHMDEVSSESMFDVSVSDSVSMAHRSASLAEKESWSVPNGESDEHSSRKVSRSNTIRSTISNATISRTLDRPDRTAPVKAIDCDKQYAFLPIGETKPCLYSRGYYPDLRRRLYHSNVISKIADELQVGLADCELLDFLSRPEVCRRLRGVLEELAAGCNRYSAMALTSRTIRRNKLDIQRYKHREKILETIESEALSIKNIIDGENYKSIIRTVYQWLHKIRDLIVDPQDAFPDIFIWMKVDGKKVAFSRLKAKDYIFSHVDDDKGKYCSRYHNLMLRSVKAHRKVMNRLNLYIWLGTIKYKNFFPAGLITGFDQSNEIENADVIEISPPRSLKYNDRHIFQLRAHIYQAILTSFSSGLLNPFVKIIFNDCSMTSQTIQETLGPMWDVTMVMAEVVLYGDKHCFKRNPPLIEVELYDKDLKSNNCSLIGRCAVKTIVRCEEDEYEIPKLDWNLIWNDSDWTAELLSIVELIQISEKDDLMQYPALVEDRIDIGSTDNYHVYRIPPCIRPKLSKYKLEVLFMGLRDLKRIQFTNIEKPRVDIELAGHTLSSNELSNFKENPNFSNPLKFVDVDLPDDDLYAPPLTIRVVHKSLGQLTLAGSHVIPYIFKLIYKDYEATEKCVDIGIDPRKYVTSQELTVTDDGVDSGTGPEIEEHEIDWWYRYKVSLQHQLNEKTTVEPVMKENNESVRNQFPEIPANSLIKIYDTELEKSKEFGCIAEWGLRSFPLYRSKKKVMNAEPDDADTAIGVFKGSIQLYKYPIPEEVNTEIKDAVDPILVLVRVYIVDAQNLVGKSATHRINPYVTFVLGGKKASDKDNYVLNQQNPTIGKCYEFEASFPQDSMLTIQMNGYDRFGVDYLIGETKIDLENRFYSRHRCTCGLPQVYETDGPHKWRDMNKPSEILEKLCNDLKLNGPEFWEDSIKIGKYSFLFTTNEMDGTKNALNHEQMCLAVLNNWKQAFGYSLIPEHIETRPLYNSRKPGLPQGLIHMWVDMFVRDSGPIPPPLDISPRKLNCYELRATILKLADIHLKDVTFFSGERTGNLYLKGWIIGGDTQITDTQRTFTADAAINWRFIFPFDYNPKEKRIVECQQLERGNKIDKRNSDSNLNIQLWDSRNLSHDKLLGSVCLNLNTVASFTRNARQCTLLPAFHNENSPQISLFKEKVVEGWWPLSKEKNDETLLMAKIYMKLELLTKEEAAANPAGFGRNGPQPLEKPKKCGASRLTTLRRQKEPTVLTDKENTDETT